MDEKRTSVYDFYQFWRNCEDGETGRLLRLFTFLPLAEIAELEKLENQHINRVKEILAFEVTAMVHGPQKAAEAYHTAVRQFGAADPDNRIKTSSAITNVNLSDSAASLPQTTITGQELEKGITLVDLFLKTGLCASKGQARRLLQQGGGYCNDSRVTADREITHNDFTDGQIMLRAGKKRYHRVVLAS